MAVSYFESKLIPEVSWDLGCLIGQASLISTLFLLLTGNRGEYLRIVGNHNDVSIDREISIVCFPFQNYDMITD